MKSFEGDNFGGPRPCLDKLLNQAFRVFKHLSYTCLCIKYFHDKIKYRQTVKL